MAVVAFYRGGLTGGIAGINPGGSERGRIQGWSPGIVRRFERFHMSIDWSKVERESGGLLAFTLTVRDLPSADDWKANLLRFVKRLQYHLHVRCFLWLVEWQKRGVPHIHGLVVMVGHAQIDRLRLFTDLPGAWLDIWPEARRGAQHCQLVDDRLGWEEYMSSHMMRSIRHYQRKGMPDGWSATGRMWGKRGAWDVQEPIKRTMSDQDFVLLGRRVRRYQVAKLRVRLQAVRGPRAQRSLRRRIARVRRGAPTPDRSRARPMVFLRGDGDLRQLTRGLTVKTSENERIYLADLLKEEHGYYEMVPEFICRGCGVIHDRAISVCPDCGSDELIKGPGRQVKIAGNSEGPIEVEVLVARGVSSIEAARFHSSALRKRNRAI